VHRIKKNVTDGKGKRVRVEYGIPWGEKTEGLSSGKEPGDQENHANCRKMGCEPGERDAAS